MRVLVTASDTLIDRKVLATVRALGRAGAHVTLAGNRDIGQPFYSRYCSRRINLPSAAPDMEHFAQTLLAHVRRRQYDVLLPMCDYSVATVVARADRFAEHVRSPVPPSSALAVSHDKWRTLMLARDLGIPIPLSFCPQDAEELRHVADRLTYPCVLKMRKGAGAEGMCYPASREELLTIYDRRRTLSDEIYDSSFPILQEYIPGETHDACLLFNHGRVRAALTQRRILTLPPTGGIGVYDQTTHQPELRDQAIALLEALNWHGPAQVEFKLDSRDGRARLMEINSRFWGGLDLAIRAGMNFPFLACRMLLDGDIEPTFHYRVGLGYRWTLNFALTHSLMSRHKLRTLWTWLRYDPTATSDLWLSDPFPHLAALCWSPAMRLWSRLVSGG